MQASETAIYRQAENKTKAGSGYAPKSRGLEDVDEFCAANFPENVVHQVAGIISVHSVVAKNPPECGGSGKEEVALSS